MTLDPVDAHACTAGGAAPGAMVSMLYRNGLRTIREGRPPVPSDVTPRSRSHSSPSTLQSLELMCRKASNAASEVVTGIGEVPSAAGSPNMRSRMQTGTSTTSNAVSAGGYASRDGINRRSKRAAIGTAAGRPEVRRPAILVVLKVRVCSRHNCMPTSTVYAPATHKGGARQQSSTDSVSLPPVLRRGHKYRVLVGAAVAAWYTRHGTGFLVLPARGSNNITIS